jgi:hypothetical protein
MRICGGPEGGIPISGWPVHCGPRESPQGSRGEQMSRQRELVRVLFIMLLLAGSRGLFSSAQQQSGAQQQQPPAKKPVFMTPSMRLAAARSVLMVRTRGSRIPFDVIKSTLEGWERFTMVEAPEKADLIIEIESSGDSGVQVSSSSKVSPESEHEEKSTSTRKNISPTDIRMTVIDARNKQGLWSATESVKSAMKEKSRENNLVEAAERLASRFHDRLEPAQAR